VNAAAAIVGWSDFFTGASASSAALPGLLFVTLSINLEPILKSRGLTSRASESMLLPGAALVVSLLGLMPGITALQFGATTLATAAVAWGMPMLSQLRALATGQHQKLRYEVARFAMRQFAALPLAAGAALLLARNADGTAWIAVALILCMVVSLWTMWILLVEILR
jgi:modulator of FtsH protease